MNSVSKIKRCHFCTLILIWLIGFVFGVACRMQAAGPTEEGVLSLVEQWWEWDGKERSLRGPPSTNGRVQLGTAWAVQVVHVQRIHQLGFSLLPPDNKSMYNPQTVAVFLLPHRHIHPTCTVINDEREAYRRFTKGQQGLVLPGNHAAVCRRIRGPSIRCGLRQTWEVVKLRKGTAVWPALACAPGRKETRSSSR